jgi:hypothetical protein
MPSLTEFSWSRIGPETQQRLGERLRAVTPLLYTRLPLLHALGIGMCFFLLPYVLWWFTSTSHAPIPPRASESLELHQLLQALQTAMTDPTLGQPNAGAFTPKDVEIALRFVIQPSVPPSGDPVYRLVPVDTALQPRQEQVQTLTMRLTPTMLLSPKPGTSVLTSPEVWPPKDGDPLPPPRLKKRVRS